MIKNKTEPYMLVLSGLSDLPSLQLPLFLVFLLVYLMTLTGNLLIVLLICTDSHLQTPMYFFLGTLACLDMGYSSVTSPRMLFDLYTQNRLISIEACITQIYFFFFLLLQKLRIFILTFYPYIIILNTIMKIPSRDMRSKAFYTCSSHLTAKDSRVASVCCINTLI
ncbi:hypothetical protein GDO86_017758 [Hymenochirus boettgeri]|uniref:G-protein coupled receptors family 1 profile domain-containing protein n=1 Tax=Hymenochirus boettgeri TaxID=247094 RepID=A0A8T2IR96_9PIPI|nr:hypothetical protein GDO86_017758 [Hymenochirus boettgeri]